jgi:hypothetical protein
VWFDLNCLVSPVTKKLASTRPSNKTFNDDSSRDGKVVPPFEGIPEASGEGDLDTNVLYVGVIGVLEGLRIGVTGGNGNDLDDRLSSSDLPLSAEALLATLFEGLAAGLVPGMVVGTVGKLYWLSSSNSDMLGKC